MVAVSADPDPIAPIVALCRDMRGALGLSQRDVAVAMGTAQSAVSDIERGQVEPRLSTLARYVRACGARLDVRVEVEP